MKRFTLMIASAAVGLALLAGATRNVLAESGTGGSGALPPDTVNCYYHLWTCSYMGDDYWSDCSPGFDEGWIPTSSAKVICGTYHKS
jgi:hypothetical protein